MRPHEPMVSMSIEIKLEQGGGQLNLAVPTEILTLEGDDGDAQSTPRKIEATEAEQSRTLELLRERQVHTRGASGRSDAARARVAGTQARRRADFRSSHRRSRWAASSMESGNSPDRL